MTQTEVDTTVLELGDIVEYFSERSRPPRMRGIVVVADTEGVRRHYDDQAARYIIRISAGSRVTTDNWHGNWRVIPEVDQTLAERAASALTVWELPEDGRSLMELHDHETREWAILMAMLPPDEQERVMSRSWPDYFELFELLAESFDRRLAAQYALGKRHGRHGTPRR